MGSPDIEKQIAELDPEVSRIYFEAKHHLVSASDSSTERFATAARIVKAFWKRCLPARRHGKPSSKTPTD
jgi:hypothetical protein